MNSDTIKARHREIRRGLRKHKLDGIVITNPANVTYVTGFTGQDSWVFVSGRMVYLITDSRYAEQARTECHNCRIVERKGTITQAVASLVRRLKSVRKIGIEETASIATWRQTGKLLKTHIKPVADILENIRARKGSSEITAIKEAADIAVKALREVLAFIKAGISEDELAGLLNLQLRKFGAENSFETIVAFGANASRPHHQPTGKRLRKNDTVLIDFGAKYKNYCSDITRCFVVGKCRDFYRKTYEAVLGAQAAAIEEVLGGAKIVDVDAAARQVINYQNLPVYGHGTGHGIGLQVHEEPIINPKSKGTLQGGNVITIEPAVYIPGKLGIRIEDDILVTKEGCEVLTSKCPKDIESIYF